MKLNILIERIAKEILKEEPTIKRYEDIKNNIRGVKKVFSNEIIKVKFNDNSSIVFDIPKNKYYQSSEELSKGNFAVEVKRYIRVRHQGNIIPFLDEFNYFENYPVLEENKKNMAIHRVTLTELRKIVLDIIKEENEKDSIYYSVVNHLKKDGKMTQKEVEDLIDSKKSDYKKFIEDFKDEKGKVNTFKVALHLKK